MEDPEPTTSEIRYNATAFWGDDPIPKNHPARKAAEERFDHWFAQERANHLRDWAGWLDNVVSELLTQAEEIEKNR